MRNVFMEAMNEVFDLSSMLAKIDYHHVRNNLTDEEREELIRIAREKASPFGGLDVESKLLELDERISKLEEAKASESGGASNAPEYTPGVWYRTGDKVMFEGKEYFCIAPDGVVCTWSPAEYPAYWEAV